MEGEATPETGSLAKCTNPREGWRRKEMCINAFQSAATRPTRQLSGDGMADDEVLVHFPVKVAEFTFGTRAAIPRRPWVIPGFCMRGHVTEMFASPGAGKSSFALSIGMLAGCGRAFGPFKPRANLRVGFASVEEDVDELYRRVRATADCHHIEPKDFGKGCFKHFEFTDSTIMAIADKRGKITATKIAKEIERMCYEHLFDLLILDPLGELWSGIENDNNQLGQFVGLIRDIARRTGVAVLLLHHCRKGNLTPGDLDGARGGSANGAAIRFGFTLTNMTKADADTFGLKAEQMRGKCRCDRAKGNYLPPATAADWFEFQNIDLGNGDPEQGEPSDHVGVLRAWVPPGLFKETTYEQINALLDDIERGLPNGERYTSSPRSPDRWVGTLIMRHFEDWPEERAKAVIKKWIESGLLVEDTYKSQGRQQIKGLFVTPDKRPSPYAQPF